MQRQLFSSGLSDVAFESNLARHGFPVREVDIGDITFQSGQSESVHRWYRLTPSFAPGLVRYFLDRFSTNSHSLVFDPFSGRGTTAIECQKQGVACVGYEINPLLQKVGQLSLDWRLIPTVQFRDFIDEIEECASKPGDVEQTAARFGTRLPDIHNVFRWWKKPVLRNLIIAREIAKKDCYAVVSHLLWLVINSAAIDCANIHRNHPTITFDDNHNRQIDAIATIEAKLENVRRDLVSMRQEERDRSGLCRVESQDSCNFHLAAEEQTFTHVVTSPPYPNRFSYVHQTRPQLHFMEILTHRAQATDIDLATVGGTWGRATSVLAKRLLAPSPHVRQHLGYYEQLEQKSMLMCNYATKYFEDINKHIACLKTCVGPGFRGAYIVGNSRLSGVEIYTEQILAKLFQSQGFEVSEIVLFRKRGGRKRLYETAVCVRS